MENMKLKMNDRVICQDSDVPFYGMAGTVQGIQTQGYEQGLCIVTLDKYPGREFQFERSDLRKLSGSISG